MLQRALASREVDDVFSVLPSCKTSFLSNRHERREAEERFKIDSGSYQKSRRRHLLHDPTPRV